ncbi:hypothetical protein [Hippea maritima]|uniref:hypothetical protein n=1 Tax=Hippea maritima TaxID=84405 RepID=UPI0002EBAF74|nr:hypothetical protein [Hippea maritima]
MWVLVSGGVILVLCPQLERARTVRHITIKTANFFILQSYKKGRLKSRFPHFA